MLVWRTRRNCFRRCSCVAARSTGALECCRSAARGLVDHFHRREPQQTQAVCAAYLWRQRRLRPLRRLRRLRRLRLARGLRGREHEERRDLLHPLVHVRVKRAERCRPGNMHVLLYTPWALGCFKSSPGPTAVLSVPEARGLHRTLYTCPYQQAPLADSTWSIPSLSLVYLQEAQKVELFQSTFWSPTHGGYLGSYLTPNPPPP